MEHKNWDGFKTNKWQDEINVKDFILFYLTIKNM